MTFQDVVDYVNSARARSRRHNAHQYSPTKLRKWSAGGLSYSILQDVVIPDGRMPMVAYIQKTNTKYIPERSIFRADWIGSIQ